MRILFVIGAGILPEQRIKRWQMVSKLYAKLGKSFTRLGHQIYYYVHPEAYVDDIPPHLTWLSPDHEHLPVILENFSPDFAFCWNGSSPGDITTATLVHAHGAKMVYSEQGWFPQSTSLYFDLAGCNGKCSTRHRTFPMLTAEQRQALITARKAYIETVQGQDLFNTAEFRIEPPKPGAPILIPLQDERDLNIVQDSPFKTMDAFLGFLSEAYPKSQFIARPHPKFPSPALKKYRNVELDDPSVPMFSTLSKCSMVVGINSTTLLESALLGYTVVSFGEGLASGTGLFADARPDKKPASLASVQVKTEMAEAALYHLLCTKQMLRESLGKPIEVMRSGLFNELIQNLNWNSIYR